MPRNDLFEEVSIILCEQDQNHLCNLDLFSTSLYIKNSLFYIFKARSKKYQKEVFLLIYAPKNKLSEYKLVDYFVVNPSIVNETVSFLLRNYIFRIDF